MHHNCTKVFFEPRCRSKMLLMDKLRVKCHFHEGLLFNQNCTEDRFIVPISVKCCQKMNDTVTTTGHQFQEPNFFIQHWKFFLIILLLIIVVFGLLFFILLKFNIVKVKKCKRY